MRVIIKNGLVIDPKNQKEDKLDILIEDGEISKIEKKINESYDYIIDASKLIVAPGFVDLHPNFCDPGVTSREDLKTGSLAAAKGGFTHVVLGTDNKPAPSQCNVIEYINEYSEIMPINIFPCAAVTNDMAGFELADLRFLANHGAIGFFDGLKPIEDKSLLQEAMIEAKNLNLPIAVFSGLQNGVKVRGINEGKVSKSLGIKNCEKAENEFLDLQMNIELAKETKAIVDFAYISTKDSVELLREEKVDNENIFAEVQALNIALTEEAVAKIGRNAKVIPPLRTEADRKAIIKGLSDGTIDIISSNHVPCVIDEKDEKLKTAGNGSIGLETVLGICGSKLVQQNKLSWSEVIEKISLNPARLYKLDEDGAGELKVGTMANITIFDPEKKWKLIEEEIVSKSKNTPLKGMPLVGKVMYTLCNGVLVYKDKNYVKENNEKE